MSKAERLAALDVHRRRLEHLVGELLRKADDLDQSTKYGERSLSPQLQQRLANTCSDLVALSEAVSGIERLISAGDLNAAQRALLKSTDIASHLSQRLREIKHAGAET